MHTISSGKITILVYDSHSVGFELWIATRGKDNFFFNSYGDTTDSSTFKS